MESKNVVFLNKLSFVVLIATIFGSLFFFVPFTPVSLGASKGFLLSIGVTLSVFLWLVARLAEGRVHIPKDRLLVYGAVIPAAFFASSLFSPSKYISFFGNGFEMGTFGVMLVLFALFFLSSIYFQTEQRLWYFFNALFAGAFIVSIFQIFYLFVNLGSLLPRFLQGVSGNLVGNWNDLALFFGLIVLLTIITIEFAASQGYKLWLQYFLLTVSLFFLMIINVPLVWILVGLFSVVIFVYSVSLQKAGVHIVHGAERKKKFPRTTLVVVLLCFVFLVGSDKLGGIISRYVNISNSQARPSVTATLHVALQSLKHNPLFGTGPNTFVMDWALWQPESIVQSNFWNVDFDNGVGTIPSYLVTTGLIGFLSFLLFLAVLFMRGLQSFRVAIRDTLSNYFIFTILMTLIYTWASLVFYTPNIIMLILAFTSSGMLVGILVHKGVVNVSEFSFVRDPRKSFFSILGLIALMMATLSVTYLYVEKFTATIFFSRSFTKSNTMQELVKSKNMLQNAIKLDGNDTYYRALSQVYIAQIGVLVSDTKIAQDMLKSSLQQLVDSAQVSALKAVDQNPKQYLNQFNLANIYAALVPLGVTNSYESAVDAYNRTTLLAPHNPSVPLARARLEYAKKNNSEAKKYIAQALALRSNYADAALFLAQISAAEGDLLGAIQHVENAATKSPNDPTIFFVMGSYRYNNADYTGAISALETAVILNPSYLSARYLLGQSYQKAGRENDALIQYNILAKISPENQEVKDAIRSIGKTVTPVSSANTPTTTSSTPTKAPSTTKTKK
jgi:tetratricopeptide (TPR) repeat protein/O-antigen ligase